MTTVRLEKKAKTEYENRLKAGGQYALYKYVVGQGIINKSNCPHPEIIILDHSDAFFSLYRSSGSDIYFTIGKILRRAAHKLYRQIKNTSIEQFSNARFLNKIK